MTAVLMTDADYLRRRSERCEELAGITADEGRRETLLSLAGVYREQASRAEQALTA
jgi:hypothetical protein